MRKNLHHKIMLSILAGSLALGFVYAPPAFAEDAVDVEITDGEEYNLNADYTISGTDYNDASITLPTGPIGTFTVTAGNGGETIVNGSTDGKGGSISLSAIGNIINNGISVTAGNGGNIEPYINGNLTSGDGGDGGDGGDVKLAFTNVVNGNIDASAGNGGISYNPSIDENVTGGNGGDATLTFKNVVTNSIKLTSGSNGGNNYISTAFKGGSVTFEANTIKASSSNSQLLIRFNKNDGDIKFTANTLEVQNGTVIIAGSCTPADGSNNHINTLLLTGSGNIDVSANIKIGSLTIDGGTIVSDARTTNVWKNIIGRDYTTKTITIGTKGATFNIVDSDRTNILTKSVTGAGNLTKTGTGTLILGKENENYTYDYEGLTVVKEGILDASISELTNSKGLTLFGGATFIANTSNKNWTGTKQNWNNKQFVVYDNGSEKSATYQGNLTATNSNLYFIASGDNTNPLLKVINNGTGNNGNVNIAGSNYNLGLTGDKILDIGSKLTLIEADGTINADNLEPGSGIKVGSTIKQDITTNIEVSVDDSGSTEKLIATVNGALATDEASAINSGMLGGLAFNLQGADLIAREGMEAAIRSAQLDNNHAVFAALTRSSLDYGAVDVDGTNMLAGLAWQAQTGAGSLTYGVFAEHGDGSYDTYANINGTSLHGEGDTDYTGGGILARMDFNGSENGHGYLEASGRVGNADTDYTNSGLRDAYGRAASYSTDGTYYGAHIGAGYVQKLDEKSSIDWYGKLLWARLEGGSADLSTGEHLTFDDADSLRLRIGGRWNYAASDFVNYYAGLGYEYEFDGEASGFTNGLALGDEDLTGGSGVAELGISFKPSKNSPFSLELNLAGFTGEREGFRGGVEAVYTF